MTRYKASSIVGLGAAFGAIVGVLFFYLYGSFLGAPFSNMKRGTNLDYLAYYILPICFSFSIFPICVYLGVKLAKRNLSEEWEKSVSCIWMTLTGIFGFVSGGCGVYYVFRSPQIGIRFAFSVGMTFAITFLGAVVSTRNSPGAVKGS